ncbi:MAG TPA: D-alanyl-D-alanine carboxypeptidase, partial [Stellaceae bacterium]|nr:D-alanyl-D-alanine carboxypeptidase [Stellaceae bacterium]
ILLAAAPGRAAPSYSSIVIDDATGKVIEEHNADAINYPASLTKMMTLYLTFQGLQNGSLSMEQRFTVSEHAAAQEPSKLGLKPGETVALKDLIFSIITHSANDAAVVVAENIGGSEPAFAKRMTSEAHALGMLNTNFADASGLPNPNNVTTARDLAILARALHRDFPMEYGWFSTAAYNYRGVNYANHNHLMESYPGMDGIKTGYIHASGFNLAASAVHDGRRLIAVMMGGTSAAQRDAKVAALLNEAFAHPTDDSTEIADDSDSTAPHETIAHRAKQALAALSPVAKAEAATRTDRHLGRRPDWGIQVGAFTGHTAAEHAAERALHRLPRRSGHTILVVGPAHPDKDAMFRARIVHFSHRDAEAACRTLHLRHENCAVIGPDATQVASK